jgi:diguanylate cyclase (GGDEF)-like protein
VLETTIALSLLDNAYRRGRRRRGEKAVITATFSDVTDVRKAEARNAYLARHDDLTRLPNRNYFTEQLRDLTDRRQGGGVLFFDLDRFKVVNDALGHHVGDLLLTAVGRRALDAIAGKGFLARFGGDEYAVLAPGLTKDQLAELADRVIAAISAPFEVDGHRVAVGAAVGIAVVPRKATDPAAPMREADLALNAAKDAGGNGYCFFEPRMDNAPQERRVLEVALWDAIDRDQFEVAYQPQVDLATGRLSGVEALVRWDHPTRGPMSPVNFIPVAESTGLIAAIGAQVLRRACREVAGISGDLRLAVNVSPVQFTRGDLVGTVKEALEESGLDPKRLDIEITESLFVNSGTLLAETIRKLKALGVGFALDDFGTGYSSLSYLRRFPIDKIKIDRSFVTGLPFDQDSGGIVRAIAAMANAMDIDLIAEGVETSEQVAFLRKLGCQGGQGFLFGRAEPLEAMLARIGAQEAAVKRA